MKVKPHTRGQYTIINDVGIFTHRTITHDYHISKTHPSTNLLEIQSKLQVSNGLSG